MIETYDEHKILNNVIIYEKPLNINLENKDYIHNKPLQVDNIITSIASTLNVTDTNLKSYIKNYKNIKIKNEPILINKILNNNVRMNKINKHFENNNHIYEKIKDLKKKLAVLQLNNIIKKDDKSDLLNNVIQTIDNKIVNINNIIENNLSQRGGYSNNYYYKYLKYKIKYLKLLYNCYKKN